jgi:transcriptional regulator GlxA family with amidase domain
MLQKVAVLVLPEVPLFELGICAELFSIDRTDTGGGRFDFTLCTPTPGAVRTELGLDLQVPVGLEATEDADLVVVTPIPRNQLPSESTLEALRTAHARGAWVMSICSGAFVLAAAGLLDGRRCTTHWMHSDELAARYPKAVVDPSVLYVEDGRVITSAGSAAGIDAGLHLIRKELGAQVAANIARRMVVPPHRDGGQAQFIDRPILACDADSLADLLGWMAANLDSEQSVDELAARALMSPRTFARRFRAETGTTPAAWLAQQRLQRARELLETSGYSVDRIAELAGFGSAPVLRHHFTREMSVTPQAYRRRFSCVEHADLEVAG